MRRWFVASGLVCAMAAGAPRPASADFGLAIALPGFGLFVGEPGPPVVYAPPPVALVPPPPVAYVPPPVVYGPPVYYAPRGYYRPGRRVGWWKHGRYHGHGRHRHHHHDDD